MAPTTTSIGVDVGGTHTDVQLIADGTYSRGKAPTTYDDFSRGVLEAIDVAAQRIGRSRADVLTATGLLVNGTTVVTNTVTELRGCRVGVLVTGGFRDTFRLAGGPRQAVFDDHLQVNVPDLVDRRAIVEVDERVDYAGQVLVPVDEDQVAASVDDLVARHGIDALAICFLSSHVNPVNEVAAARAVRRHHPDLFLSLSHEVFPVRGETRRWTTAVLNSFVHRDAHVYVDTLSERLTRAGLGGQVAFFQGLGGAVTRERAKRFPLTLIGSGPAGGALGARRLAERLGSSHVLLGDMGGTSFDTGIIQDGAIAIEKNVELGPFQTGVDMLDVISVGAGGGSVAWVSERGVPQVGPRSMGSTPGPACYDKGGEEATVTDAMVALGFMDPDNYLGGRMKLRADLATAAIDRVFGEAFGWSPEAGALAIHDLAVTNMANAVREVSVRKGHDPRGFAFLAYGGSLPFFAWEIAARCGMSTVVVPDNSSVFCAQGLVRADYVLRGHQSVGWTLDDVDSLSDVNRAVRELVDRMVAGMGEEGFGPDAVEVACTADVRFVGQVFELTMPMPARDLTEDDIPVLLDRFRGLYERAYGRGTAWRYVPAQILNYTVTVTGLRPTAVTVEHEPDPVAPDEIRKATRRVVLPGVREAVDVPIYDDARFTVGSSVPGPAIVDAGDTTVYVPPDVIATRDELRNYVLRPTTGEA